MQKPGTSFFRQGFLRGGDPLDPPSSKRPIAVFRSNNWSHPDSALLRIAQEMPPKPGAWFLRTVRRFRSGRYVVGLGPDLRRGHLSSGQGIHMDFRRGATQIGQPSSNQTTFRVARTTVFSCPGATGTSGSCPWRLPISLPVWSLATKKSSGRPPGPYSSYPASRNAAVIS